MKPILFIPAAAILFSVIMSCGPTSPADDITTIFRAWYLYQSHNEPWATKTVETTPRIINITEDSLFSYDRYYDTAYVFPGEFVEHYLSQTSQWDTREHIWQLNENQLLYIWRVNSTRDTTIYKPYNGAIPPWPEKTHIPCE